MGMAMGVRESGGEHLAIVMVGEPSAERGQPEGVGDGRLPR